MKLVSNDLPERILVYGPGGAGKTYDALTVAKHAAPRALVVDIDNAIGILAKQFELKITRAKGQQIPEEGLIVWPAHDWESFTRAIQEARAAANPDDWIIVDSVSLPWHWVQEWQISQMHGGSKVSEWLLSWRQAQAESGRGGKDIQQALLADGAWQIINAAWHETVTNLAINPPCHLFFTAEAKAIHGANESSANREMYGRFGMKPEAQWALGYKVRTVLLREKGPKRVLTTVKDWGREHTPMERKEVQNFAFGYLMATGDWIKDESDGTAG